MCFPYESKLYPMVSTHNDPCFSLGCGQLLELETQSSHFKTNTQRIVALFRLKNDKERVWIFASLYVCVCVWKRERVCVGVQPNWVTPFSLFFHPFLSNSCYETRSKTFHKIRSKACHKMGKKNMYVMLCLMNIQNIVTSSHLYTMVTTYVPLTTTHDSLIETHAI